MADTYANVRVGTDANGNPIYGYTGQDERPTGGVNMSRAGTRADTNPYVYGSQKARGPLTYGGYNTRNQFGSNPSKNYGVPNSSGQRRCHRRKIMANLFAPLYNSVQARGRMSPLGAPGAIKPEKKKKCLGDKMASALGSMIDQAGQGDDQKRISQLMVRNEQLKKEELEW